MTATTRPSIDTFGPGELLRFADASAALARGGMIEFLRRGPTLALSPRQQPPRALAAALRRAFEDLGPAYLKFGQIIASSPGLFPNFLAFEFRKCLDAVAAMPSHVVRRRIATELGAPVEVLFDDFDDVPLASASIAQVHTARIDGRAVVVKVRRPGLVRAFHRDLRILYRVANVLDRTGALSVFNPVGIVEDFARTLFEEIDLVREAHAMETFAANLRAYGDNGTIRVPEVVWDRTSERVLTMTRESGVPPDDRETIIGKWGVEIEPLFQRAVRAWVEAAFVHGFFHGDLHAGNLLVNERGEVVFLDFGIMGSLDARQADLLRALFPTMVIDEDWERAARIMAALAPDIPATDADISAMADDLEHVVGNFVATRMADVSYGSVLEQTVRIAASRGRSLLREHVLIAKQFLYFERYAKILAPDYAVFGDPRIFETLVRRDAKAVAPPQVRTSPRPDVRADASGRVVAASGAVTMVWSYPSGPDDPRALIRLYEKAKRSQWNASTDVDWSVQVDPTEAGAGFGAYLQLIPSDTLNAMTPKQRAEAGLELSAWMNSQFLHGEQGAMMATAKICAQVPWSEAKLYGATQVMDEARHAEAYSRYLREKLERIWPVNPNLATLLDMVVADSRWDVTYLGMQILVEGIALAAFGLVHRFSTEPLIRDITRYVMADEARHVAFGTLSLTGLYDELSEPERREREDFVLEATHLMRDRFLADDVWAALGVPKDDPLRDLDHSPMAQVFRRLIFAKITPNLRKLGLMTDRLRDGLVAAGVVDPTLEGV
jgi:predicted unusual protein kinase regulating ubiquinone biosynthesis (AarF/ABC1/UbiB family)